MKWPVCIFAESTQLIHFSEKVKVASFISLENTIEKKFGVAARGIPISITGTGVRRSCFQFFLAHEEFQTALRNIESDEVTGTHEG